MPHAEPIFHPLLKTFLSENDMSQRTLNWPRRIACADRTPLSTAHGSFCLQRVHLGDAAFDRQRIRLTGYLIVLAREGSVILDRGQHSVLLREGDATLIPAGEFAMTEIPRPQYSRGVTWFYFFNERALADSIRRQEGLDEVAARISLPALPFYPVQRLGDALHAPVVTGSFDAPTDLGAVFTGLVAARPTMVCTFLKHVLFVPRVRLCLFLEGQCMGKIDLRRVAASYPDGAVAFRRDCANYLDLSVDQWLFRRRIELARHWLRYTDRGEDEVRAQLGYRDRCRFRGDMNRFCRFSPLELKTLRLLGGKEVDPQASLPFWFPDREARAARGRRNALDGITLAMEAPTKRIQRALLRKYADKGHTPVWTSSDVFHPTPARAVEAAPDDRQETLPDNVIAWNSVEKWRAGESSLEIDRPFAALAAA